MADKLLMETGDTVLLETGDKLLLEQQAGAGSALVGIRAMLGVGAVLLLVLL